MKHWKSLTIIFLLAVALCCPMISQGELPQMFESARMSGSTLGKDIPANIGDLEDVICDALGFTIDSNITESPTGFDNSGRFTKALLRHKAAAPVGWRERDSTGGSEYRMVNDGTYVSIDRNDGTESSATWTNIWKMNISTGVVTFSAIPTGPASNPTTDNQFSRKAYVDGLIATKQDIIPYTTENSANKGAASGYASLNSSSKVVENPANATATPTASKIPIADGSGTLNSWVTTGGYQVFTSSGTFTVPTGITRVLVSCQGGGGGGYPTAGGGGGAMESAIVSGLTPGATVSVTVGAGGASGVLCTDVGYSSFGSYLRANGGSSGSSGGAGGTHYPQSVSNTFVTGVVCRTMLSAMDGSGFTGGISGSMAPAGSNYGSGANAGVVGKSGFVAISW